MTKKSVKNCHPEFISGSSEMLKRVQRDRKTNSKILIAPSILSADFTRLREEIRCVEKAGADWIHVDVMDGHFVPNLTVGPVVVHWIRKATPLFLDTHLMIESPEKYLSSFASSGADGLTIHYEACVKNTSGVIRQIRRLGKKVGISLRPKTPVAALFPYLAQVDLILVMTVEPGFGGQKFMPEMLLKVRKLNEFRKLKKLKLKIEVDGGINAQTGSLAVREGADVLVAGHSIFGERNPSSALKKLRKSIDKLA